ncbi:NAD(P)-dependent oxidoreductase [Chitinophaga flava]|uniref:Epimerase n=1 Tax=Chitinophaga flava TaxID=2259036 RepID=A0A365Y0G7_9BACT|nr:NAD(P)H-binding protein [Chitinophaga flava]RBL91424.1 epimerase [Chitinophaga flava]
MKTTIAVIGGTGKAGQYLVKQLLLQGYHLRLLLRNPNKYHLRHPAIQLIKGDVLDPIALSQLIPGCDAVISTLGSRLPPIFSSATQGIINTMQTYGLQRYIVITGLSIDVPGDDKSEWYRQASTYMRNSYPDIIADKQREYEQLTQSTLDWTLARIPLLEQTTGTGAYLANLHDCPAPRISASDLAVFLVSQLGDNTYVGKAPFVASVDASEKA